MNTEKLYDNFFTILHKFNGLYESYDINGKAIILAPTESSCLDVTRAHIDFWKDKERPLDSPVPPENDKYVDL